LDTVHRAIFKSEAPVMCIKSHEGLLTIESEDECEDPFKDGGSIRGDPAGCHKRYGEDEFNNDKRELHPERGAKYAVFSEVYLKLN
jgi:hypothetical protein